MSHGPEETVRPAVELTYAEATEELDEIIAELDQGVVDVDVLEERLRRAVEIVEELDRRIRGVRERVGAILPRLESVGRTEPAGHAAPERDATGGQAPEDDEPF
ncbi:MAG: hypothetical protein ACRD0B_03355 [Acidimicrobiales bacterium]